MWFFLFIVGCSTPDETPSSGPPPAAVTVALVREGQLSEDWTLPAEVRALERAELASGASGAVVRVTVREGDAIAAGVVLVEVDSDVAAAQLSAARAEARRFQADLAQAERTLTRVLRVDSTVLAAAEIEQAETLVATLRAASDGATAQARLAQAQLARHRVTSPFSGIVAERHVDTGDWVTPGTRVLDVVRTDSMDLRVNAPVELAQRVSVGDSVRLGTDGVGVVVGVVPALDPVSRTAPIRVSPSGDASGLIPGSTIDVVFDVAVSGGVIVPRDAVVQGAVDARVFRVSDDSAEPVVVQVLATTATEALVSAEGLQAGDALVVRGNERLRPGQRVLVGP